MGKNIEFDDEFARDKIAEALAEGKDIDVKARTNNSPGTTLYGFIRHQADGKFSTFYTKVRVLPAFEGEKVKAKNATEDDFKVVIDAWFALAQDYADTVAEIGLTGKNHFYIHIR